MQRETNEIIGTKPLSDKDLRKLLLKFVLLDGQDSISAFADWERGVIFDDASFQSFKLLSAVYAKLLEQNISSRLFLRIKGAHRRTWTENQLLLTQLKDLFADLDALQINFIIADEAFRLTEIYNDIGIFSLQNFSVMAPIRQKKEFCRQLIENLWEISDDDLHRTRCTKNRTSSIEILWANDKMFEGALEEAETVVVGDRSVFIIRVEEQILNLCENRFLIEGDEDSGWQFIAGALFKSDRISSSKLIGLAQERQLTHEVAKMIDVLAADFDLRFSADLLAELKNSPRPGRILLLKRRINKLRQDYQTYLKYDTRESSRAGLIEFLERRWGVDSYKDLVRQGIRSCIRLLQAR